MMKKSVAMLAVCMLAQSHLAIAAGTPAPQEINIVLLGTKGGPSLLNTARLPQATALTIGDKIWLIDAGYGASLQLVKNGIPLRNINTILLTHLHSNHILDYPSLLMNAWASGLKDHTIQVYGPPGTQAMTKASWKVFDRDITLRMEEEGKPDPRNLVKANDIGQGVIYKDELVTISALKVPHSPFPDGEAFAYRFDTQGKRIVFSGDTSWFPPLATFAQGADILVHEAGHVPSVAKLANSIGNGKTLAEAIASHHTTIEDVGKIAREAHVKKLVLSHLVPATVADDVWQQEAMKNYPGPVIVGHDNMTISVP
ncbi:MBL fold metallo-hydrolase [Salmonella enterica]|uniref:MBL fold metallo-hydrolase n=1 Tax=Salmonella enterica TaxID=28901 RepID=UPI000BE22528|nr:MBL fold metallo-hydrolase [Salmonella enterica]PDN39144.1 MBL fold metallo-hydrolase [Salmonella enterica]